MVRNDASGKAERMTDLMQVIAELTDECFFRARTGQESSIGRQRIKRAKEAKTLDECTHKRIYGDHPFRFELTERHVNRPLIRAGRAKAVKGQVGTFTDAHAGVANQQKSIATQVIAAEELLLQELVLLWHKWARKSLREAWKVLAADQMGKFRKLLGPGQLIEDAAQSDKPVDIGRSREWRHLRAQAGHPAEDMGLTA